ncbi:MAG: phosphate acyltransferase PlsX [Alphaproteobacteria bacterium]
MTNPVVIAVDTMGGDNAPRAILRGANIARKRMPGVEFLLFGDENKIKPLMRRLPRLRRASTIVHAPDVVPTDAKPVQALRQGRHSSMRMAIEAVRDGKARAVVSAGNTGALMAMAKVVLRMQGGIDRPAMTSFIPTLKGESAMLDLGANVECDEKNLYQFAVMGELFARTVLGMPRPSIGLLNVGSEEVKGNDTVRGGATLIKASPLGAQFHGFIEGNDIAAGTVDVIVADGFSGNIALKTAEGTVALYTEFLRQSFRNSFFASLGYLLARRALTKLKTRLDPRRYNGAVFLGLNGVVVKSHGGTDALGFATAVGVAVDMVVNGFIDKMKAAFDMPALPSPEPAPVQAAAV